MTYIQSHIGGRTENQDFYGSAQTRFGELIIVCDGMGGHGGRYAAERAVQIVIEEVTKSYNKNPSKALHRTSDHSLVFDLVRIGKITEEQARLSDKSNIITRSLGKRSLVDIEITANLGYHAGDRFLLCTDGLWSMMTECKLIEMISEEGDVESVVTNLVDRINTTWNWSWRKS
jgi:serine/threonine protein phosphatase PrpC